MTAQFAHSIIKTENPNPGEAAPLVRLAEDAREAQAASAIEAHFAAVDERQPSELPFALWLAAVSEVEDARLASPVVSNERKRFQTAPAMSSLAQTNSSAAADHITVG